MMLNKVNYIPPFFYTKASKPKEAPPWEVSLLYNEDGVAARYAISMFSKLGLKVGENMPYSGKVLNATMNRLAPKKWEEVI